MKLDPGRALADAVLLEGYALYPYRASAPKNQYRWTFGVLAPRAWSERTQIDPWWLEAQLLVAGDPFEVAGELRFFQIERRDGSPPWDEGVLRAVPFRFIGDASTLWFDIDGDVVVGERDRRPLCGRILLRREVVASDRSLARITIRVENTTRWDDPSAARKDAITAAFASTHLLLGVEGGELLSAIDPPEWARTAAASCRSTRTFPILAGPPGSAELALCAPFIMNDHPQLAPESAGDLCDASEIDELLVLRTLTLTDAEKREARATDPRTAAILARAETLAPEQLARMHGASRDLRGAEMVPRDGLPAVGAKVRLLPPTRATDAQDLLYVGLVATVRKLRLDVDGSVFVALTFDDDPAAELHDWYGRYHYYRTDEVEVM